MKNLIYMEKSVPCLKVQDSGIGPSKRKPCTLFLTSAKRPCFSIGCRTPDGFYRDFMRGLIEKRDAFASRTLDPTPKFVRERLSTSVNENGEVLYVLSTPENGDKGE